MSERTRLARRHLLTALSIGAAALASKAAQAQLLPESPARRRGAVGVDAKLHATEARDCIPF